MGLIENILYDTVYHSAPIILCVIGGMFAYKANVLNIALEGMMLNGAFIVTVVVCLTGRVWLGIILAVITTLIYGLIFSFMGISRKGNVIIVGLAINLIVPAIAGFVLQILGTSNLNLTDVSVAAYKLHLPIIKNIPILGSILSGHPPITYLAFIGILLSFILMYKTKFGIYIRVTGENEDAAKSLGINTNYYKYAAVLLGAVCCAFAGINFSLERLALYTNNMTVGRGFIAVAAIYCGQGNPIYSSLYAILFGAARSLAINLGVFAGASAELFDTIPYLVMVTVLAIATAVKYRNTRSRVIDMN